MLLRKIIAVVSFFILPSCYAILATYKQLEGPKTVHDCMQICELYKLSAEELCDYYDVESKNYIRKNCICIIAIMSSVWRVVLKN